MCVLLKHFLVQFILYCSMSLFQQQTLRTYILYKPCIQRRAENEGHFRKSYVLKDVKNKNPFNI